ncbi:LytR/AlgR family response regulator transcription factor [Bacteroidota bacterium]
MQPKYKAIIVDDENLARKDLAAVIAEFGEIEIVGEAKNIQNAVDEIQKNSPNLIFLDIKMPGESGFDLIDSIKEETHLVFVTAFDEYAIRAFEVNALDYLLKPVTKDRLALTLEKIADEEDKNQEESKNLNYDDQIFLKLNNKYHFLKVNNILQITAEGDYSKLLTKNGEKSLATKSMKEWEDRLPENHFIRIHRSTIINTDEVDRIEPWYNNAHLVYLKGIEKPVVMSRRYFSKIKEELK